MSNPSSEYRYRKLPIGLDRLTGLIGDPLVHFLLIGACLFALTQAFAPRDETRTMHVNDAVYGDIVDIFAAARGRAPSETEMAHLAERWLVDETLYREAMARGLDEGDSMIRERINQKMRVLVQSSAVTDTPDEADLRAYFSENRTEYDTPARLSFSIARIDGSQSEAQNWARNLESGGAGPDAPQIYDFLDRPRPSLVSVFGEEFVGQLETLALDKWQAVDTSNGWQAVRLETIEAARAADFEELRDRIQADWESEAKRAMEHDALEAMIADYDVVVEPYDPADFEDRAAQAAKTDPVVE